jgi:methionine--tRNA ligase beta chain
MLRGKKHRLSSGESTEVDGISQSLDPQEQSSHTPSTINNSDEKKVPNQSLAATKELDDASSSPNGSASNSNTIDISKLDIRVGLITKAWEHPEADKLFCEEIDLGEATGPRSIASGLRQHYKVEDLVGRRVLVLANLKERKLVGYPSHGMVLCASNDDGTNVQFVDPPNGACIGERILCQGFVGEPVGTIQIFHPL